MHSDGGRDYKPGCLKRTVVYEKLVILVGGEVRDSSEEKIS